jgi:hypothetical protein
MASKKTLRASEQDREDIRAAREEWQQWSMGCEKNSLVFIDRNFREGRHGAIAWARLARRTQRAIFCPVVFFSEKGIDILFQ